MKDELAARRAATAPLGGAAMAPVRAAVIENPRVQCGCGRWQSADLLLDVRALPASIRPRGDAFICDACRERLIHSGQIAREDLYRLVGAPPEIVARMHAYALAHDPIRKTKPVIPLPTP